MNTMLLHTPTLAPKPNAVSALRLLIALPGLHRVTRGAEVALEELARHIARRNDFAVTLIGTGAAREDEPYRYRQTSCIPRERFEKWPSLPGLRDHFGYEELSFVPGLFRTYRPEDFDVTLTCGYPFTNWVLRSGRKSRRPKHVYVTQNGDWAVTANNWEYRYFGCDGLVCTNPDYYQRNRTRWNCALIPNGVNPDVFCPGPHSRGVLGLPEDRPVVLMVSALAPNKLVLEGIRAVASLPDIYLVIAGDGELRREVDDLGNQLMPGRFRLSTFPRARMPELYRSADAFLHMSQDEPSANAYVEALASGLPIITHDRDVTRWTMEDQAVFVDTSDAAAVCDGVSRAMSLRQSGDVIARREIVDRRFAWSAIADDYCRFLASIH
jgi:glycosyltransferase involved in cell wall biosynthesis